MTMAKTLRATPVVRGRDADRIRHEMVHGTPNTPQRVATIRRADALIARMRLRLGRKKD
jgi:hypothetical protein